METKYLDFFSITKKQKTIIKTIHTENRSLSTTEIIKLTNANYAESARRMCTNLAEKGWLVFEQKPLDRKKTKHWSLSGKGRKAIELIKL